MQVLFDWFWFVVGHLLRIIVDLLSIILSPVIFVLYAQQRGGLFGGRKKFKSVLITGATSGIGKALAIEFAEKGVSLVLTGRNATRLKQCADEAKEKGCDKVVTQVMDVGDKKEMGEFISQVDKDVQLDLVIANAGIGIGVCSDKWYGTSCDEISKTNIHGVLNTILPGIYAMQTRAKTARGHVAVVGSIAGWVPTAGRGFYSASKAACRFLCDDIRPQLVHWKIDTSYIAPGYVNTGIMKELSQGQRQKLPGIMRPDQAAKIIRNGLERNQSVIGFPSMMFNLCWLAGGLHPYLFSLIQSFQKITQYQATEHMVNRDQFKIEHGEDDAWH